MGANTGKIRLLRLYQYLRDNTDVDHAATTYDLLDMLAAEGIQADRKTLKSDMEVLTSEATGHAVAEVAVTRTATTGTAASLSCRS